MCIHGRPGTATDGFLRFQDLPKVWFVKVKEEESGKLLWPGDVGLKRSITLRSQKAYNMVSRTCSRKTKTIKKRLKMAVEFGDQSHKDGSRRASENREMGH